MARHNALQMLGRSGNPALSANTFKNEGDAVGDTEGDREGTLGLALGNVDGEVLGLAGHEHLAAARRGWARLDAAHELLHVRRRRVHLVDLSQLL